MKFTGTTKELEEQLSEAYHTSAVRDSYAHRSSNGSAYSKMYREEFVKYIIAIKTELEPLAETDKQKDVLSGAISELAEEYLTRESRVLRMGGNVVSVHIAGGSNFNHKQSQKRGSAYDNAVSDFYDWRKKQSLHIETLLLKARNAEQIEQANQAAQAKLDKIENRKLDYAKGALEMFKGKEIGNYIITKVSIDKDGYPSSYNAKGKPGTPDPYPDKFEFWRTFKFSNKAEYRTYVDKYKKSISSSSQPNPMALAIAMAEADRDRIQILKKRNP
jgi:hypothetical protein